MALAQRIVALYQACEPVPHFIARLEQAVMVARLEEQVKLAQAKRVALPPGLVRGTR